MFSRVFLVPSREQEWKFEAQLEYLASLLSDDLNCTVSYKYEQYGKAVMFRTKKEIIAYVALRQRGLLQRNEHVWVRLSKLSLSAWFQLAFLGMKVTVVELKETLSLTHQKPREL